MWILDGQSLLRLDALIEEECARLIDDANKDLENEVRREQAKARKNPENESLSKEQLKVLSRTIREDIKLRYDLALVRAVTVVSDTHHRKSAERFGDLIQDGELADRTINEFEVRANCCGVRCTIRLILDRGGVVFRSAASILQIETSPRDERAERMHGRLAHWAHQSTAPGIYSIWRALNPFQWFAFIAFLAVLLAIVSARKKEELKVEARALVEKGVDGSNQQRALELILALLSDAPLKGQAAPVPFWFWGLTFSAFLLCVLAAFHPKDIIGIGRGERSIQRRRGLYATLSRIVLGFVFFGVVTSIIGNLLTEEIKKIFGG